MTRIFLIGYMCSGKTTLGRAFALKMGLQFIDMDWYIEGRFHKTVKQIFAELGEGAFREMERKMLHEVGDFEDVMIATGGGTACFFDNVQYMNQQGQTVYMKADIDTLFNRLQIGKAKRPLLMNKTDEEIDAARPVIGTLGGEPPFVMDYRLPGEDGYRRIVTVYKRGATPRTYPRKWSKIKEAKFVPPAEETN